MSKSYKRVVKLLENETMPNRIAEFNNLAMKLDITSFKSEFKNKIEALTELKEIYDEIKAAIIELNYSSVIEATNKAGE